MSLWPCGYELHIAFPRHLCKTICEAHLRRWERSDWKRTGHSMISQRSSKLHILELPDASSTSGRGVVPGDHVRCQSLAPGTSWKVQWAKRGWQPQGGEAERLREWPNDQLISINELPTKAPFRSVIYTYCRITKATWHNCWNWKDRNWELKTCNTLRPEVAMWSLHGYRFSLFDSLSLDPENILRCCVSHGGLRNCCPAVLEMEDINALLSGKIPYQGFFDVIAKVWLTAGRQTSPQIGAQNEWTLNSVDHMNIESSKPQEVWSVMAKSFHIKGGLPEHDFAWFCSSRSSMNKQTGFEVLGAVLHGCQCDVLSNWIGTCKWEFSRMMYGIRYGSYGTCRVLRCKNPRAAVFGFKV